VSLGAKLTHSELDILISHALLNFSHAGPTSQTTCDKIASSLINLWKTIWLKVGTTKTLNIKARLDQTVVIYSLKEVLIIRSFDIFALEFGWKLQNCTKLQWTRQMEIKLPKLIMQDVFE
jgi:hypothetical protein